MSAPAGRRRRRRSDSEPAAPSGPMIAAATWTPRGDADQRAKRAIDAPLARRTRGAGPRRAGGARECRFEARTARPRRPARRRAARIAGRRRSSDRRSLPHRRPAAARDIRPLALRPRAVRATTRGETLSGTRKPIARASGSLAIARAMTWSGGTRSRASGTTSRTTHTFGDAAAERRPRRCSRRSARAFRRASSRRRRQ